MNVLYTCDNNYVWLMGISVISLFENNKETQIIEVYLLGENISTENKERLKKIGEKYGRTITVIDVPEFDIPSSIISSRWPLSAFTRLFSGQMLPISMKRVLYLDCDTIIKGNIKPLEKWDMQGKIFCGVKDCIGSTYKKNIGLQGNDAYINAGVLLIDLDKLRKIAIYELISRYMAKYEKFISYADQDILNGIFNKEIGILPPRYDVMTIAVVHKYQEIKTLRQPTNFYTAEEIKMAVKSPVIIHYTTNMLVVRPWFNNSDHPLAGQFEKYKAISPWKDHDKIDMKFGPASKILAALLKLPDCLAYKVLGFIHAKLKPNITKLASKV